MHRSLSTWSVKLQDWKQMIKLLNFELVTNSEHLVHSELLLKTHEQHRGRHYNDDGDDENTNDDHTSQKRVFQIPSYRQFVCIFLQFLDWECKEYEVCTVCTALQKWLSYFTIIMAEKQFTPTFSLFGCMMMMMEGSGKKEKGRHRAVTESGAKSWLVFNKPDPLKTMIMIKF